MQAQLARAPETQTLLNLAVDNSQKAPSLDERHADHDRVLAGYLDTHRTRNHTEATIHTEEQFLRKWFTANAPVGRAAPLFVWEAMEPIAGRERVLAYVKRLVVQAHQMPSTVLGKAGVLRRFFEYALVGRIHPVGT